MNTQVSITNSNASTDSINIKIRNRSFNTMNPTLKKEIKMNMFTFKLFLLVLLLSFSSPTFATMPLSFGIDIPKDDGANNINTVTDPDCSAQGSNCITRRYDIYIPDGYDLSEDDTHALVFFFHQGSSSSDECIDQNWDIEADEYDFVLVCPQGEMSDSGKNWRQPMTEEYFGEHRSGKYVNDYWFISKLKSEITSNYDVDEKRTYATGFSRGAGFIQYLSGGDADGMFDGGTGLFNAIAPVESIVGSRVNEDGTWKAIGPDTISTPRQCKWNPLCDLLHEGGTDIFDLWIPSDEVFIGGAAPTPIHTLYIGSNYSTVNGNGNNEFKELPDPLSVALDATGADRIEYNKKRKIMATHEMSADFWGYKNDCAGKSDAPATDFTTWTYNGCSGSVTVNYIEITDENWGHRYQKNSSRFDTLHAITTFFNDIGDLYPQ